MIERTFESRKPTNESIGINVDLLPKTLRRVILHCENYSCLAQVNEYGNWCNPFTNEPITARVLDWEPI